MAITEECIKAIREGVKNTFWPQGGPKTKIFAFFQTRKVSLLRIH